MNSQEDIILSDDESILSTDPELENDSESIFTNERHARPKTDLLHELRKWKINHNISNKAFDELLLILSRHGHLSNLSNSTNPLKREARSPIMVDNRQNWKVPCTSNNAQNTHDISARLNTVEQKIDMHQIATQQVLSNQAAMQQMLNLILEKLPGGDSQILMEDLKSDLLPITTVDMLEEYEVKLRSCPDFKNKMIRVLSQFGGPDAKKTTRNIARAMISDEVLVHFSWTGTNTKKVFSSFREIHLTIITTMRKKYPNYTEYDNATFFKEYLKHASTRLGRIDANNKPPFSSICNKLQI